MNKKSETNSKHAKHFESINELLAQNRMANLLADESVTYTALMGTHLIDQLTSIIDPLIKDRESIRNTKTNEVIFKVAIYNQDPQQSFEKFYCGRISKILAKAESDYKKKYDVDFCQPDLFNLYWHVNGRDHILPRNLWDSIDIKK